MDCEVTVYPYVEDDYEGRTFIEDPETSSEYIKLRDDGSTRPDHAIVPGCYMRRTHVGQG